LYLWFEKNLEVQTKKSNVNFRPFL
jgi:hypothetical protein